MTVSRITGKGQSDAMTKPFNRLLLLTLYVFWSQVVIAQAFRLDANLDEARTQAPTEAVSHPPIIVPVVADGPRWQADTASSVELRAESILWKSTAAATLTNSEPLGLSGGDIESVRIRMKVSGVEALSFAWCAPDADWSQIHRCVTIPIIRPGEMYDYEMQLSGVKAWRHIPIQFVRFALPAAATVELESVTFIPRAARFDGTPAGLVNFAIADQIRPSVFVHTPARLTFDVDVPERPVFSAGVGLATDETDVVFALDVTEASSTECVGTVRVQGTAAWREFRLPLDAYAGRRVTLTLRTDSAAPTVALWSNPILYSAAAAPRWNVLFYVIDTLRADHMNLYGYDRETAPFIAQLASEGVWFQHCYANETWTKPSMVTMFTGTDTFVHNIQGYGDMLPTALTMWPETLRTLGYATCSISENPHTPPDSEYRRAFSYVNSPHLRVDKGEPKLKWNELPAVSYQTASDFLDTHQDRNFLLYMQTMECHDVPPHPEGHYIYETPEPYRSLWLREGADPFAQSMDLYDGGIRYADDNLKKIVQKLKDLGLYDSTLIVVVSDHGEAFKEHEDIFGHYNKPYNELIHVPLIMRIPDGLGLGTSVDANVQLMDLAPTLFDLLGIPASSQHLGNSLRPLIADSDATSFANRTVYSLWQDVTTGVVRYWKAWRDGNAGICKLYHLEHDPGETKPLETTKESEVKPGMLQMLLHTMTEYIAKHRALYEKNKAESETRSPVMDPTTVEQLKNLQYL